MVLKRLTGGLILIRWFVRKNLSTSERILTNTMDIWIWRCAVKSMAVRSRSGKSVIVPFGVVAKIGGDWKERFQCRLESLEHGFIIPPK